jgi:uncharacterized membrane protein
MGWQHERHRYGLAPGLGGLFMAAGAIQATHRDLFSALVPRQFAQHSEQIQGVMTGALTGLGVSFLVPPLRLVARWGATAVLVGSLPAAIDQIRNPPQALQKAGIPPRLVIARIPAQLLVVALTWIATRKPTATPDPCG